MKHIQSVLFQHQSDIIKIHNFSNSFFLVSKRSTDVEPSTYTQYAGKQFEEIKIANLAELEKYESDNAATK